MTCDFAIVGGGIVGLATAMTLAHDRRRSVVVLEAEDRLATHQTGHNSGVIHSGLYYRPDSLKARNCVEGRKDLIRFCEEHGAPYEICGKLVVATRYSEIKTLDRLEQRGRAKGLEGLRRLSPEEAREVEPHVSAVDALLVPDTGIVDFARVAQLYAEQVEAAGGQIRTGARATGVTRSSGEFVVETSGGEARCRVLINCAGLQSDRVARMCGVDPGVRIVPFKGEYCELVPKRHHLVRNLIYPVPDPRYPFLGVHFTRMIGGGVEAGPNAVLAWKREDYGSLGFSFRDALSTLTYPGFWKMAARHWRMGLGEQARSLSRTAFVSALRRLVPEIRSEDVRRAEPGVRAQALAPDGKLLDDFHIVETRGMVHVLNAPSPAATASLRIGRTVADLAGKHL